MHGLGARYDLPPELSIGFMQLFLLDCGLILLPLSVAVTQQRMAASRADAGRETLERLVDSATGTAIVAIDEQGRITLFNPGAVTMYGYAVEEVLGETPDLFHPPEELARQAEDVGSDATFAAICRAVVASENPRRLWRFVRRGGEERTLSMTLSAVPDEHGRMAGYLCTAEDVTERENTQSALVLALEHQEEAVSQLRQLSRIKSDFVATVSHELRTPITSIVGYTELLEDGVVGELSAGQRDMIGRVDHNSRRLLLLIEDLLTLSHIESATLTLQPKPFDLRDAVTNAHATVVGGVVSRPLDVVVSVPDEPVDYLGDPDQLERMVLNLLTNAVKFTPDGGHVHVELTAGEQSAELVVRDDGLGIPEGEQDQLFTRFFRSSTATERAIQGTGLGLSIVQAVVTLHGGTVALSSAEGEGTVATVRLPWLGVASGATVECTAPAERVDPVESLEQRSG